VIGDGDSIHAKINRTLQKGVYPYRTVEETVLGVNMKVYKMGCGVRHFLKFNFIWFFSRLVVENPAYKADKDSRIQGVECFCT